MRSQIKCLLLTGLLGPILGCGGDGDAIVRVSRQNNSGTYHYFREAVLGREREFTFGSIDLSGSKDVVEMVSKMPNAVGYSGMGYATPEVKMLPLFDGTNKPVAPTSGNAADGTYPLARGLYVYILGEPEGAMKHFSDWIMYPDGQALVAEIGYVPVPSVKPTNETAPPDGIITVAGYDTMVNLAQA